MTWVSKIGQIGELCYRSPSVFPGYFGRKKDMVIRGGFNISRAEVENAVLGFAGVKEVAVVSVPDEVMGKKVFICVVSLDSNAPPALEEINEFLKEHV